MLANIGGETVEDMIRRIMAKLLDHDLALRFNLSGQANKFKFLGLNICDTVCGK